MTAIGTFEPLIGGYVVEIFGMGKQVMSHADFDNYIAQTARERVLRYLSNNKHVKKVIICLDVIEEK